MVDKVDTNIIDKSNVPTLRSLLRKLGRVKFASTPTEKLNKTPNWLTQATPFTAKKARTLGTSPTDADMASPQPRKDATQALDADTGSLFGADSPTS